MAGSSSGPPWWLYAVLAGVLLAAVAIFVWAFRGVVGGSHAFENTLLEGELDSTNATLGSWQVSPSRCVDGRELGFHGIAFFFPAGSPVDSLRIDTERDGDNVVEVRLDDRAGTTYRVHEAECETIDGTTTATHVEINHRRMYRLKGKIHFSCPKHQLDGWARFSGCLPESLGTEKR